MLEIYDTIETLPRVTGRVTYASSVGVLGVHRAVKQGGSSDLPASSADSVALLYFEGVLLMRSTIGSAYDVKKMVSD